MKNLLAALQAVMKAAGYVQKNGVNQFHKYRYAGESDLLGVVRPAMVEHGLFLIGPSVEGEPRIDEHGNTFVAMSYTLAHVSGEVWPHPLRIVGCGNDKSSKGTIGDKGVYKAYTGGNKYMLFKLLQIATGDDPEEVAANDYAPGQEPASGAPKAPAPGGKPAIAFACSDDLKDELREVLRTTGASLNDAHAIARKLYGASVDATKLDDFQMGALLHDLAGAGAA
jgi:hypothetical protein